MSVNIRNPLTGELTNASGGVINPKSINEMIAPIEDGTASKAYAVGEQFIMNDLLCEATQAIAQGDTMVIGTNCEESEQLSKQVKDINTSLTANGNRFEAGYSSANDKYGFNIGSTFYPIGASSGGGDGVVPLLDFDNAIALSSTAITTTKDGCVVGGMDGANASIVVQINDKNFNHYQSDGRVPFICIPNIPKGSSIKLSKNNSGNFIWFVPYTYATVDPTVTVYNGVDIELNYSNPLHKFTPSDSYTTTKPCYLIIGDMRASGNVQTYLKVNGTTIACAMEGQGWVAITSGSIFRLSRGDTVTTDSSLHSSYSNIYVLEGSVVSPEVTVYNEAELTLDYANPLHRFSVGGSYTATQDCWLVGSGSNLAVTIDGTRIGDSTSANYLNIPPTKLVAGQTVSTTGSATGLNLYVLKGTVTGSVGAFKREVQRNYYFGLKYGAPVDIDISSLKDTEEITITVSYSAGNSFNSERVSVSTAKTYNSHILEAQANIGTSITYVNGKLQFVASHTTYSVMVWVTFN